MKLILKLTNYYQQDLLKSLAIQEKKLFLFLRFFLKAFVFYQRIIPLQFSCKKWNILFTKKSLVKKNNYHLLKSPFKFNSSGDKFVDTKISLNYIFQTNNLFYFNNKLSEKFVYIFLLFFQVVSNPLFSGDNKVVTFYKKKKHSIYI